MKRVFSIIVCLVVLPLFSFAEVPDLSSLSYDELVEIRNCLNIAIWESEEWKQVEVPYGVYIVGVDIPAGHWSLKAPPGGNVVIEYFQKADASGKRPADVINDYYYESLADESSPFADIVYVREVDLELKDGFYFSIVNGPSVIFEPYVSKTDFFFFR